MKPFSELFTNNFFVITVVVNICTQSIDMSCTDVTVGSYHLCTSDFLTNYFSFLVSGKPR